jgi:hypothetical protein
MTTEKKWLGKWPAYCDECGRNLSLEKVFYDARTISSHWGLFCHKCFTKVTYGRLGTAFGQKYDSKTLVKLEG